MPTVPPQIAHKITITSYSEHSWVFTEHNKQVTFLNERGSHQIKTTNKTSHNNNQKNQHSKTHYYPSPKNKNYTAKKDATQNTLQIGIDGSLKKD